MGKDFLTAAAWTLRLGVWLVIGLAAWRPCFAQDTTLTLPPLTASNAAAQGNGTIVRTGAETPASQDPVSVFTTAKPGVELYVAVARLYEESGRLAEAEQQYKKGLKESPDDLRPLLGYARLKDRLGQTEESLNLYRKAVKAHPRRAVRLQQPGRALCAPRPVDARGGGHAAGDPLAAQGGQVSRQHRDRPDPIESAAGGLRTPVHGP